MALYFPDILEHGNPDLPVVDSDFLKGGTRSPVQNIDDLYLLAPKVDQLKERATKVYVSGENKYYILIDSTKVDQAEGWAEENSGGGSTENVVYTTGDQDISGIKTFVDGINIGNASNPVNSLYVRSGEVGINNDDPQAALDVSGLALFSERPQVNGTGVLLSGDIDVANLVYTTGNQIISGVKTFEETGIFNSGISVTGTASFTDRPTVNGTGVMLQGENAGAGQLFTGDITVSIPNGTSFGKYLDGATIPASGLSANDVIIMACFNAKEPTLTFTPDSIPFGFAGNKTLSLTFGYTINTLGATTSLVKIETKKATDSTWSELRNETSSFTSSPINQTHDINHTLYDTTKIQYRFTVKDNLGGEKVQIFELTPSSYVAPSISGQSIGANTRYKGDTATTYTGTITKNTSLVPVKSYVLQRDMNNSGSWTDVGSIQNVTNDPSTISISLVETESGSSGSIINANSIAYRILVKDEYTISTSSSTNIGLLTISFLHRCGTIYSSKTSLDITDVDDASIVGTGSHGMILQDAKARSISPIKPGSGNYLYYVYKASLYPPKLKVVENGVTLLSSAFSGGDGNPNAPQFLNNVTNKHGATVSYVVHRSSAVNAFGNAPGTSGTSLAFSNA